MTRTKSTNPKATKQKFPSLEDDAAALTGVQSTQRAPWRTQGACMGGNPRDFFPERGEEVSAAALSLCASCGVRLKCLGLGLQTSATPGIWGGRTAKERRRIQQLVVANRQDAATPEAPAAQDVSEAPKDKVSGASSADVSIVETAVQLSWLDD